MTRVATFAVQNLALTNTQAAQARNADLQIAVSTGQNSRDYKGIGESGRTLINFETLRESALRFVGSIETADQRLAAMENASSQLFDLASELRTLLVGATSTGNAPDLVLQQQANQLLEQAVALLNTDQDGRFLFAGARTDIAPVDINALLNPVTPLVDAVQFTGAATTAGTGILSIPGIVSVQVPSGSTGDALQLTYDGAGTLSLTNLQNLAGDTAVVTAPPPAGETSVISFTVAGQTVEVTIDENFAMATPITTQPITGTVAGGPGAFGAITVTGTLGDISQINNRIIDVMSPTADASNITLTLPSADGNFVATGLDFETVPGVQSVTLTNATTNAQVTLDIDIAVVLADATVNDPGTELDMGDFLINMAATAGAINSSAALPGQLGYDPTDPSYYLGDNTRLSLRADDQVTVDYGVTAIDAGFEKLIRALYITTQASDPTAINIDDLNQALGIVTEAITDIPDIRAEIGTSRVTLEDMKRVQEDATLLAEQIIGDIENVDVAEALTLLAQNTTTIEASYSTLGRLNSLTLLEFI